MLANFMAISVFLDVEDEDMVNVRCWEAGWMALDSNVLDQDFFKHIEMHALSFQNVNLKLACLPHPLNHHCAGDFVCSHLVPRLCFH